MYEWFWGIFAKRSKLHDAGGPDTVVSPSVLNVKVVVAAFNQEKALVGAFSVIVQLQRWIGTQHYSRIPNLKCYKSEIMFTNGLRHSWHHHEVVHAHGGHVIHLVLLEKLLQVSPQQIHKVDKLNVFMIIASLWDYSGDLWRCGALEIELSTELREIMQCPLSLVNAPIYC